MNSELHSYVKKARFDRLMTFLISNEKYDIDQVNSDGDTALHLACKDNNIKVAKALIAFDAEVNSANGEGRTPLDVVRQCHGGSRQPLEDLLISLDGKSGHSDYSSNGPPDTKDQTDSAPVHFSINQPDEDLPSTKQEVELSTTYHRPNKTRRPPRRQRIVSDGGCISETPKPEAQRENGIMSERNHKDSVLYQESVDSPEWIIENTSSEGIIEQGNEKEEEDQEMRLDQLPMTTLKCRSSHNPNMETQESEIGVSSVHKSRVSCDGDEDCQRILCLDGGGMKGLIQIEMLKAIERMTGKSISELFDWVVGTSTGGILALGMIYGKRSLKELRKMYFEMKDRVFKKQSKIIGSVCDTVALEKLLTDKFGTEMSMESVDKPKVLITAVEKSTTKLPLVYFSNCAEIGDSTFIRNELVWKVARYTSAAPVFFAECDNYVDGGVKANNPTAFAITEIQDYLSKLHKSSSSVRTKISCVVSLGCGDYPEEPLGNTDVAEALNPAKMYQMPRRINSLWTLFKHALGVSEETVRMTRISCEQQNIAFFRFSPLIGKEVGTTEKDSFKLCEIIIRTKQLFIQHKDQVQTMVKELGVKSRLS